MGGTSDSRWPSQLSSRTVEANEWMVDDKSQRLSGRRGLVKKIWGGSGRSETEKRWRRCSNRCAKCRCRCRTKQHQEPWIATSTSDQKEEERETLPGLSLPRRHRGPTWIIIIMHLLQNIFSATWVSAPDSAFYRPSNTTEYQQDLPVLKRWMMPVHGTPRSWKVRSTTAPCWGAQGSGTGGACHRGPGANNGLGPGRYVPPTGAWL